MGNCFYLSEMNRIVGYFILIVKIIVPIIIILTAMKPFIAVVLNGKNDELKTSLTLLVKKIIAGLAVLLIPTMIPILFEMFIDDYDSSEAKMCNTCVFSPASKECDSQILRARELFADMEDVDVMGTGYEEAKLDDVPIEYAKNTSSKESTTVDRKTSKGSRERLLKSLDSMSKRVAKDVKNGAVWKYSNKGCKGSFEAAMETNTYKTNCALGVVWALKSAGILEAKQGFWTISDGNRHAIGGSMSEADIAEKFTIVEGNGIKARELIKNGTIEAGDVILWYDNGHTNVYAGNNSWYDMGRNFTGGHGSMDDYSFTSFGPIEIDFYMNARVWRILKAK